jgi:hypothetical protein
MNETTKEEVCNERLPENGSATDGASRTWTAPKLRRISTLINTEAKKTPAIIESTPSGPS